ncbi:hypothetical protein LC612_33735 [Nostoc sp. CHAB 5834]|nr:hypothetical protein [Nostoc sp. CHAB 5834]
MIKSVGPLAFLTATFVAVLGGVVFWAIGENQTEKIDHVGSFMSGGTAAIAILWLVYNSHLQKRELSIAMITLKDTRLTNLLVELERSIYNDATYILKRFKNEISKDNEYTLEEYTDPIKFISESKEFKTWTNMEKTRAEPTINLTIINMREKMEWIKREIEKVEGINSVRGKILATSNISQAVSVFD